MARTCSGNPRIGAPAGGCLSRLTLKEGPENGVGNRRGDAICASVERRQGPGLSEPGQGDLGSRTFPGPERGARNSSPGVGVRTASILAALPPWASQGHRDMDSQTPDQSSGVPGPVRGSPPPQIRAEALRGLVRAHGAAAPLDPGLGAPREAGWKWPPWGPPAPHRGPRRFRSSWSGRESRDAPPALYIAGKPLFLSTPPPHPAIRVRASWVSWRGWGTVRHQSAGWEKAHPHFFLGKLRPRGVACPEITPSVRSSAKLGVSALNFGEGAPYFPSPRSPPQC